MKQLHRFRVLEICAALALTLSALIFAQLGMPRAMEKPGGGLHVSDAWMRPTIGTNPNSAAYMSVMNHGKRADRLIEVRGDVAKAIELHTHVRDGDVMRMRQVKDGFPVDKGKGLVLQPGGHHIMLLGLTRKLEVGTTVPLTLVFEHAGEVKVDVEVQMKAAGGKHHHH